MNMLYHTSGIPEALANYEQAYEWRNVEENIDASTDHVTKYRTQSDDPEWVRQQEHVYTVGIQQDSTLYTTDVVMAYDAEHDVMFPVLPEVLSTLPLVDGSTLSNITNKDVTENEGGTDATHDE